MKCYLPILLFTLISCTPPLSPGNDIKISIDVQEIPAIGLAVSTTEYDFKLVNIDSNKHGEHVINNMDAAYIILQNGFSERKTIYAEKGDHLHLSFDGKSMKKTAKITGDNPVITEYLSRQKIIPYKRDIYSLSFPEFKATLKEKIAENYMLLDSFQNSLKNEKFVKLERARIKYTFAAALLNYPKAHGWKDPGQIEKDYYTTIKDWIEEDKDYLNLNAYRTFVSRACLVLASQKKDVAQTEYGKVLELMHHVDQNFREEEVKQGFIFTWANEFVQRYGINQIDELDKFVREKLAGSRLLVLYEQVYDSWARITPGNDAIDFLAQDSTGKEYTLKNFKNQYTCLYLWQNVTPCIAEFACLKKLVPLFEEKNILLINLSIEPKIEQWKESIKNIKTQTGIHLFLENKEEFLQKYHYNSANMNQLILIAPNGKIVSSRLPNASSGKLEKYLTRLL